MSCSQCGFALSYTRKVKSTPSHIQVNNKPLLYSEMLKCFRKLRFQLQIFPTSSFIFSQMILLNLKCERSCRIIQGCAHHSKLWLTRCGKVAAQVCCHCSSESDFPESLAINWFQLKTRLILTAVTALLRPGRAALKAAAGFSSWNRH